MSVTLRSPSDGVDARSVPLQLRHRHRRRPDIQDHNFIAVHESRRHVPQILLVPSEPKQGRIGLRTLVDDRGVFLVPQIEDSDRSVGRNGGENPSLAPGDVVDLLVVRDELRLDDAFLDVPDGAGGVDAGGADPPRLDVVPVERRERRAELAGLAVVEDGDRLDGAVADLPEAEVVAGGGEDVEGLLERGRVEHQLRRRVRVVEGELRLGG